MGMNPRVEAATQSLNQAQQDRAFTESLLSQQRTASESSKESKDPLTREQQIRELENQLHSLQGHYTENHPDIVRLKKDIADLQQKLEDTSPQAQPDGENEQEVRVVISEPREVRQLRARLQQIDLTIRQRAGEREGLQRQIKILESKIQSSPMIQQEFKALTREHQSALDFYNDLLKKRNESQMATELERRQQGEQFRELDPPSLPEKPSFPIRRLFGLGGLGAGLVLGLGMALILELRSKSIWTKEDIEFYLRVPTLGLIPSADFAPRKRKATAKIWNRRGVALRLRAALRP
jgi:uncharacterized protein involved in exopolysaccharide biosynthesis